jgi:hypothetical protein
MQIETCASWEYRTLDSYSQRLGALHLTEHRDFKMTKSESDA